MATIIEDYISFEIAKLLKEKGFPQQRMEFAVTTRDCSFIVNGNQKVKECAGTKFPYYPYSKLFLYEEDWAVLPTLQMAMKWLRLTHKIYIQTFAPLYDMDCAELGVTYNVVITNLANQCLAFDTPLEDIRYNSPEEAHEAAIKYSLENLI